MMMIAKNQSAGRDTYAGASLPTTSPIWNMLGLNPCLSSDSTVNNVANQFCLWAQTTWLQV